MSNYENVSFEPVDPDQIDAPLARVEIDEPERESKIDRLSRRMFMRKTGRQVAGAAVVAAGIAGVVAADAAAMKCTPWAWETGYYCGISGCERRLSRWCNGRKESRVYTYPGACGPWC